MWGYIIAGIGVALLAAYIGFLKLENSHLTTQLAAAKAQHALYVQEVTATNDALKASAAAITLKYKQSLVALNKSTEDKNAAIQARIKADKALAAVVLSSDAVSVFNDGKAASQPDSTPDPKSGDAKAGSPAPTLADLLSVVKVNEANQNECVDSLTAWQNYWHDFQFGVAKVGG
jgi:hypothetical protein